MTSKASKLNRKQQEQIDLQTAIDHLQNDIAAGKFSGVALQNAITALTEMRNEMARQ